MNGAITYQDLLSLLAVEVEHSSEHLHQLLLSGEDGLDKLKMLVGQSELPNLSLTLASPLLSPEDGAPLLAGDADLSDRKLGSLISRQFNNPNKPIGPFILAPTEQLIGHYRAKVERKLGKLIGRVRSDTLGGMGKVHAKITGTKEMACVESCFFEAVDELVKNPAAVPSLLNSISSNVNDYYLTRAINTAFITMAVLTKSMTFSSEEQRQATLTTVGCAALMQDIAIMSGKTSAHEPHAQSSRAIALQIGLGDEVCRLIGEHHTVTTPNGNPILDHPENQDKPLRALVAVNVFLDEMRGESAEKTFEVMKNLTYLCENSFIDDEAVKLISELCLPKIKSFVLDRAAALGKLCPQKGKKPILWPIVGDKVPTIFLCPEENCEHWSAQLTIIARDIPFEVDSVQVSNISKGDYHTCPILSKQLKVFYQLLQKKLKGAQR